MPVDVNVAHISSQMLHGTASRQEMLLHCSGLCERPLLLGVLYVLFRERTECQQPWMILIEVFSAVGAK